MAQDTPISLGTVHPTITGPGTSNTTLKAPSPLLASSPAQPRGAGPSKAGPRSTFIPRPQPGCPVYKNPKPMTWVSYSGQDIRAYIQVYGRMVWLANMYTLSYSSFRDIIPVRGMGQAAALAHARGHRTVAGSMVFTQFNKEAFFDWLSYMGHDRNASGWYLVWVDQIPPFNLLVLCQGEVRRDVYAPEWGDLIRSQVVPPDSPQSRLIIYGVSLAGGGSTMSVDDMITEGVYNYHAPGIAPLTDVHDGVLGGSPGLTGEDPSRLIQESKSAQSTGGAGESARTSLSAAGGGVGGGAGARAQQPSFEDAYGPQDRLNLGSSNPSVPVLDPKDYPEVPLPDSAPLVYNPGGKATAAQVVGQQDQIKASEATGELWRLQQETARQVMTPLAPGAVMVAPGSSEATRITSSALGVINAQGEDRLGDKTPIDMWMPNADGKQIRVVASPAMEPGDAQRGRAWIDTHYGSEVVIAGGRAISPPSVTTLGRVTSGGGKTYDVHIVAY